MFVYTVGDVVVFAFIVILLAGVVVGLLYYGVRLFLSGLWRMLGDVKARFGKGTP